MNRKGSLAIMVIVVLVTILIIGGILYYTMNEAMPSSALATPSPTPSPTSENIPSGWQTYRNDQFGFEVSYPSDLILSSETASGFTGAGYVSGTPTFYIGTMNIMNIEASPGKPTYADIEIAPTQCFLNYWGTTPTTSVTINGIQMTQQDNGALYMFPGNSNLGWNADCNSIWINVANVAAAIPGETLYGSPDEWASSTYQEILQTFRFVQ